MWDGGRKLEGPACGGRVQEGPAYGGRVQEGPAPFYKKTFHFVSPCH